jgi:hypothetical protein
MGAAIVETTMLVLSEADDGGGNSGHRNAGTV